MTADFMWDLVRTLVAVVVATVVLLVIAEAAHTQRTNRRKP